MPYPESAEEDWKNNARIFMTSCAAMLAAKMFKKGLPIRGVIHEGDFITKNMCMAGKGIVEAYRLCGALDFSGVVVSEKLGKTIKAEMDSGSNMTDERFLFLYLVPLNNGDEVKLITVNWLHYDFDFKSMKNIDVDGYVLKSFWAHQKNCSTKVDVKVRNTVKLIRRMLLNY